MAPEMDENRKCKVESAAKIMIGKIGRTNQTVQAVQLENISSNDQLDGRFPALICQPKAMRCHVLSSYEFR